MYTTFHYKDKGYVAQTHHSKGKNMFPRVSSHTEFHYFEKRFQRCTP